MHGVILTQTRSPCLRGVLERTDLAFAQVTDRLVSIALRASR